MHQSRYFPLCNRNKSAVTPLNIISNIWSCNIITTFSFISLYIYILYTAIILAYPVIPYAYELDITISRISRYYIYICPRRKIRDRFYGSLLHTLNVTSMLFFVLVISDTDRTESNFDWGIRVN